VSVGSRIWTLAALAPVIAGCGVAKHLLPGGTRHDGASYSTSEGCLFPPDAELSCAAFAVEGSAASPPALLEESEPELLPLTAPGGDEANAHDASGVDPSENDPSAAKSLPTTAAAGFELPAPVIVETEEEARRSLALEAASLTTSPRRTSTDVTIGPLKEPIERDPPSMQAQQPDLPLVPPAPRLPAAGGPVRADYVNAPLAKVARHLHLPHGRIRDGAGMRPGLIAGLHGRIAGHREPPEPVPFVVYERVAPRFLPVPTRPAFEPATATYAAYASPGAPQGISIRPPLGITPSPFAEPQAPPTNNSPPAKPAGALPPPEETLPRPLQPMDALPLPQPGATLPPAPRIDDF
jgi:hypothetical protein